MNRTTRRRQLTILAGILTICLAAHSQTAPSPPTKWPTQDGAYDIANFHFKDGETIERGPYGVAAIDARSGKVLWRYKGADKGITNLVLANPATVTIAASP